MTAPVGSFVSQFGSVAEARRALGERWTAILRWAADCAGDGAGLLADLQCENIGGPILARVLTPWGSGQAVSQWLTDYRQRQTSLDDTETDVALGELANVERDLVALRAAPKLRGDASTQAVAERLAARPAPIVPGGALGARLRFAPSPDPLETFDAAVRWLPGSGALGVPPARELTPWEQLQRAGRWVKWGAVGAALGYVAIKLAPVAAPYLRR